jgi:CAAX prenyl protease-like protein
MSLKTIFQKSWLPYVAPFVLFVLLTEPGRYVPSFAPFFYIAKTFFVGSLLWIWRHKYAQDFSVSLSPSQLLTSIACGLLVLVIWIVPEGYFFQLEQKTVFDPRGLGESRAAVIGWLGIRLLGASLVVPVMEELFWRSFLMRYLFCKNNRHLFSRVLIFLSNLCSKITTMFHSNPAITKFSGDAKYKERRRINILQLTCNKADLVNFVILKAL